MKKIIASLAAFMLIICGLFTLASCNNDSFYNEWHSAGAEIETDNVFKSVTVSDVENLIKDSENNTFALFMGSSANSGSVSDVTAMQYTANVKNYDGKVYFLTTTNLIKNNFVGNVKEIKEKLGNKVDISEFGTNVVCVMYEKGRIKFITTDKTDEDVKQFIIDGSVSIVSVLEYVIEICPVKK